jgi:hypothetical protein
MTAREQDRRVQQSLASRQQELLKHGAGPLVVGEQDRRALVRGGFRV